MSTEAFDTNTANWYAPVLTYAQAPQMAFASNVDRARYHLACARPCYATPAYVPHAAFWRLRVTAVRRAMHSRGVSGWIRRGRNRPLRGLRPHAAPCIQIR